MRILVTNDDGISSPSLRALAKWATKLGDVTVVAPKVEQSGKSQSIDFFHPGEIKRVEFDGLEAWAMDSTPADCVRFGILGLEKKYDLVLSGINKGYNLGDDIVYSGTCGAIFEGARIGIKGLAISADRPRYLFAAAYLDGVWDYIVKNNLFSYNSLYNVNIPTAPKDFRITKQGGVFYTDEFVHKHDDMYMQEGDVWGSTGDDPNTDINAIKENVVSITPLIATRTEMAVFEKLKNL